MFNVQGREEDRMRQQRRSDKADNEIRGINRVESTSARQSRSMLVREHGELTVRNSALPRREMVSAAPSRKVTPRCQLSSLKVIVPVPEGSVLWVTIRGFSRRVRV